MKRHVHILGIGGTFMAGLAIMAKAKGHKVTGMDGPLYPPMSTQLQAAGIDVTEGYDPKHMPAEADDIIIGNALSRGNPCVEAILDQGLSYTSAPEWLQRHILNNKWVIAVAGTHGKTTTSSMIAWILEYAKLTPGFLIGGIPKNFEFSARVTDSPFFVVEADEYDTAFFDKRSKFCHFSPKTCVLNNLEYDHADIFVDLAMIETQFHHLVRRVPSNGKIFYAAECEPLKRVLAKGCWTPTEILGDVSGWSTKKHNPTGKRFEVFYQNKSQGMVDWDLVGDHNIQNGLAAIAASQHVGVPVAHCIDALNAFAGVKRRLEHRGTIDQVHVYDDFAHHPTAIANTLHGVKAGLAANERLLAVLEPRSNTMKLGQHAKALQQALNPADKIFFYQPDNLSWSVTELQNQYGQNFVTANCTDSLVDVIQQVAEPGDHIVIMSNGGFDGLHDKLLQSLSQRQESKQ